MASPSTHLTKIDTAIDAIVTAMADTTEVQSIKIRGREIERKDFARELEALVRVRAALAPSASRESTSPFRLGRLGYPTR